jgi:CheY-like chemotaxis protein
MPALSGIEVVAAFRSTEAKGLKAIVIGTTGHVGKDHEEACLEVGMDAVLIKPIEPESLASVLCALGALQLPAGALGGRRVSPDYERPLDLEMLRLAGRRHTGGFAAQVDVFVAGMEGELVAARSVFATGTGGEVHNTAHSLLSLCNVVRYEPMTAIARNMEAQSGTNDRESLIARLGRLEQQFAIVRSLLLAIRNDETELGSPAS